MAASLPHHDPSDPRDPAAAPMAIDAAPRRRSPVAWGIGILAVIAIVAALYLARAFFVPLLIGIIASYALRPPVNWLKSLRIPRAAGAALVVGALVAGLGWAAFSLGDDAAAMIQSLPEGARKVRQHVSAARKGGPTALQKIQEAATELQGAAAEATGERKAGRPAPGRAGAPGTESGTWLNDYLLAQSALLATVAAQAPIVLLLAYFLLASGDHFRRKLVQLVGPSRKQNTVQLLEEIDAQIQRYLLVTVGANVLVGAGTWLAFEAVGMEQAGVWGVTAGVLHFIPYLGPVLIAIASGVAGFMQFGTVAGALGVAGASVLVAAAVGQLFLTWVQSRIARVNAAVLFIALLFFGWLWGIWGLLLGAPLLAIAKVICDRVAALRLAGELLGP